jgi:plasmid stability protein
MKRDLVIRDVDEALLHALRKRASRNGRTIEEEARIILSANASEGEHSETQGLASRIRKRFTVTGGISGLAPKERTELPRYAEFGSTTEEDGA